MECQSISNINNGNKYLYNDIFIKRAPISFLNRKRKHKSQSFSFLFHWCSESKKKLRLHAPFWRLIQPLWIYIYCQWNVEISRKLYTICIIRLRTASYLSKKWQHRKMKFTYNTTFRSMQERFLCTRFVITCQLRLSYECL